MHLIVATVLIAALAFVVWIWLYRRWREAPAPVIVIVNEDTLTPFAASGSGQPKDAGPLSPSGRGDKDL